MDTGAMATSSAAHSLDIFSKFYAVVLNHEAGQYRVRWSAEHGAWIRTRDFEGPNRRWRDAPAEIFGRADAPDEEDRAAAVTVAHAFASASRCDRCRSVAKSEQHFIAPNVHGEPEVYCLQMPSYTVVDSRGGDGEKKHWGSPFGCQSVEAWIDDDWPYREFIGPVAAYVYGSPLPAEAVIDRDWCSRCVGAAHNARTNAATRGESAREWASERNQSHVRALSRDLAEYYGDR